MKFSLAEMIIISQIAGSNDKGNPFALRHLEEAAYSRNPVYRNV